MAVPISTRSMSAAYHNNINTVLSRSWSQGLRGAGREQRWWRSTQTMLLRMQPGRTNRFPASADQRQPYSLPPAVGYFPLQSLPVRPRLQAALGSFYERSRAHALRYLLLSSFPPALQHHRQRMQTAWRMTEKGPGFPSSSGCRLDLCRHLANVVVMIPDLRLRRIHRGTFPRLHVAERSTLTQVWTIH